MMARVEEALKKIHSSTKRCRCMYICMHRNRCRCRGEFRGQCRCR